MKNVVFEDHLEVLQWPEAMAVLLMTDYAILLLKEMLQWAQSQGCSWNELTKLYINVLVFIYI